MLTSMGDGGDGDEWDDDDADDCRARWMFLFGLSCLAMLLLGLALGLVLDWVTGRLSIHHL
jgi:hypothetical protein